jgi:hypothetical protein
VLASFCGDVVILLMLVSCYLASKIVANIKREAKTCYVGQELFRKCLNSFSRFQMLKFWTFIGLSCFKMGSNTLFFGQL